MSVKRHRSKWFLALMCLAIAEVTQPQSFEHTLKLLEAKPSAATRQLLENLFQKSSSVTVYYTPVQRMGRSEFTREEAERYAKYILTYQCGSSCERQLSEFKRRLSSGRRVVGDCPRPIGIVVFFSAKEQRRFESLYISSHGLCYSIGGQSYFVDQSNSLAPLVDPLQHALQFGQ